MHPRTSDFARLPYSIRVAPHESSDGAPCYFAQVAELEGCESHGHTASEALANVREALVLYLDSMLESGQEPPRPAETAATLVLEVVGNQLEAITTPPTNSLTNDSVWTRRQRTVEEVEPQHA